MQTEGHRGDSTKAADAWQHNLRVVDAGPAAGDPALEQKSVEDQRKRDRVLVTLMASVGTVLAMASLAAQLLPSKFAATPWLAEWGDHISLWALPVVMVVLCVYVIINHRLLESMQRQRAAHDKEIGRQFERNHARILGLQSLSQVMAQEVDSQRIFEKIAGIIHGVFECDRVSVMIRDGSRPLLIVQAAVGHPNIDKVLGSKVELGSGVAGWVAERMEPLILGSEPDTSRFKDFKKRDKKLTGAMVVPIIARDELVGVISVGTNTPGQDYDDRALQALQVFAWNAGLCIRHAEQRAWMLERLHAEENAA